MDFKDKTIIKRLIEKVFAVKVLSVNTLIHPSKKRGVGRLSGYKATYKRVIITLLRLLILYHVFTFLFFTCVNKLELIIYPDDEKTPIPFFQKF